MKRNCIDLVNQTIKKSKHSKWLIKSIREIENRENKTDADESKLCSLYDTLIWIPFSKDDNEIRKFCKDCDYNKFRNSYYGT